MAGHKRGILYQQLGGRHKGNSNIHKNLDEFEIRPDPTLDLKVTCPCASKKSMLPLFMPPTLKNNVS